MLGDVHVYDVQNKEWDKPINCKGEQSQWHSSTYIPDRKLLLVFGGETMDPVKKNKVVTTDSLRVLDTEIMVSFLLQLPVLNTSCLAKVFPCHNSWRDSFGIHQRFLEISLLHEAGTLQR